MPCWGTADYATRFNRQKMTTGPMPEPYYADIEDRLRPLVEPLETPRPGDWLAEHREKSQTFRQYLTGNPVRRDRDLTTIDLCVIGECDAAQQSVLAITLEFLLVFFDSPVVMRRTVTISDIPDTAKAKRHSTFPATRDRCSRE